jgi:hypothetical protein
VERGGRGQRQYATGQKLRGLSRTCSKKNRVTTQNYFLFESLHSPATSPSYQLYSFTSSPHHFHFQQWPPSLLPLPPSLTPIPTIPPTTAVKDKAAASKRFEVVYSVVRDDLLADFRHNMPEESITDVCVTHAYMLHSRRRPDLSPSSNAEHGLQCPRWKT